MAEIRISKLTKQFNVGLATLVDFLNSKGANLSMDPNAKVSEDYLPALQTHFAQEVKAKQEADSKAIKIKEIIESSHKKPVEDDYDAPAEVVIKSNNLSGKAPVEEVKAAPAPAPAPKVEAPKAEPKVEEPKPVVDAKPEVPKTAEAAKTPAAEVKPEAPKVEEPKAEAPKVVEPVKEQPAAETPKSTVKIIGKIDLNQKPAPKPAPKPVHPKAAEPVREPAKVETKPEAPVKTETPKVTPEPRSSNIQVERLAGPKIVSKIDLSQFETPKKDKNKKRERIVPGKVDVAKVAAAGNGQQSRQGGNGGDQGQKNNGQKNGPQGKNGGGNPYKNGGKNQKNNAKGFDRFKQAEMTEAEKEEMQKQIQKQIKETYARMNESKVKTDLGAKHRKEKREAVAQKMQEEIANEQASRNILKVTEFVTVNELATLMGNTPVNKVIGACMSLGLMVSINQRLDAETLVLVAEEFGYKVEFVTAELQESISNDEENDMVDDTPRPPIITVMGHVDHGKTSLLDNIRNTNVIAGEAGGITQHIGAYNVQLEDGRRITFLDTPGHEAFTAMRARGAKMTDLAIIIIAADDALMPQSIEAINHAQAAGVPMVFAINKIDKPGANPERIREQLANMNILVEDWGGKYQCQEISAKKGINVDKLLDKVLLEADLLELKANPARRAVGTIVESSLDKGRGYLATVLVQNGTLRVGDMMLSGCFTGRVKAMFNERGQKVQEAGPATPVSVLGLNGAPQAGENFNVMADEKEAKEIAQKREQLLRIQGIKTQTHVTLEELGRRIALGSFKELNIIVKADVDGSIEALSDSLIKLSTEQIQVNVIHKAVGEISESDVLLAAASDAVIIGFNVRPSSAARKTAEKESIDIRLYSVIYDAINEVKEAMEGMLEPDKKEEITATAEVRETFKISKVGTIAGCFVRDGKLTKTTVRVIRNGVVVYTGEMGSLKRFKDDVKEVYAGQDCGLNIQNYNDVKVGDVIEAYNVIEIKRKL